MEGHQKKYNVQSVIRTVRGRDCEVEMVMRYLKDIGVQKTRIKSIIVAIFVSISVNFILIKGSFTKVKIFHDIKTRDTFF